jgi:putative glutathione S-transferase
MGVLVEGKWQASDFRTPRADGTFQRPDTVFRRWVTADGSSGFKAEPGRYHLYVSLACPWAHRTIIFRELLGLTEAISLSGMQPLNLEDGWVLATPGPVEGATRLYEVYQRADPRYSGRVTVPVLWDTQTRTIVNNESSEIIRMLSHAFAPFARRPYDFYPAALQADIERVNERVYTTVNNGVYRTGFATTQDAYEAAVAELFASLDWLEELLAAQPYLAGTQITEADWRLFTTLIRFDAVYYGHFKCNRRHVYEYPNLWAFVRQLYQQPGVAATVDLDHIKRHYYGSHRSINPTGIVPVGPVLDLLAPHGGELAFGAEGSYRTELDY